MQNAENTGEKTINTDFYRTLHRTDTQPNPGVPTVLHIFMFLIMNELLVEWDVLEQEKNHINVQD